MPAEIRFQLMVEWSSHLRYGERETKFVLLGLIAPHNTRGLFLEYPPHEGASFRGGAGDVFLAPLEHFAYLAPLEHLIAKDGDL